MYIYLFLVLTLYTSLVLKSYPLTIILSVIQMVMLALLTCLLFPMGRYGISCIIIYIK